MENGLKNLQLSFLKRRAEDFDMNFSFECTGVSYFLQNVPPGSRLLFSLSETCSQRYLVKGRPNFNATKRFPILVSVPAGQEVFLPQFNKLLVSLHFLHKQFTYLSPPLISNLKIRDVHLTEFTDAVSSTAKVGKQYLIHWLELI